MIVLSVKVTTTTKKTQKTLCERPRGDITEAYKTIVFLPNGKTFVHFIPLHQGTTVNS